MPSYHGSGRSARRRQGEMGEGETGRNFYLRVALSRPLPLFRYRVGVTAELLAEETFISFGCNSHSRIGAAT